MTLGKLAAGGYAAEFYGVIADVGDRHCLGRTRHPDLQKAEVQTGSGKRQGQRGIDLGGVQNYATDICRANAARLQCPSRLKQGRGLIRLRLAKACRSIEDAVGFAVDIYLISWDVTSTILSAADGLPDSSWNQNGAIRKKRSRMSVTTDLHISRVGPRVGCGIVELR